MFHQIRRHQKWLWVVISAAVIISFVIYFTPDANVSLSGGGSVSYGFINGRSISKKEVQSAYAEAQLQYLFRFGNWPGNDEFGREMGFDIEREVENRLFINEKLDELNIQVSEQEVADWIAEAFTDRQTQTFRRDSYDQFVRGRLAERGLRDVDFQKFVRNEVAIGHLVNLAGLTGRLVAPREAEAQYRRENELLNASVLNFSLSNHLASVNLDPAALQTFYTNRMAIYRLPERVAVTFVKFEATNYFAEADKQIASVTNYAQMVDAEYQKRGAASFKDFAGNLLTPEAAKEQIRSEHRMDTALVAARRKAAEFVEEVLAAHEADATKTNLLEQVAQTRGMVAIDTAPFTQRDGPREMRTMATFSTVAFKLTPEEPYSNPIPDEEAVYAISLKQRLPSSNPPWESVQARVTEEFRRSQALDAARNACRTASGILTNGLAAGRKFEELCAEAKVTPIRLPAFSQSTRSLPEAETNRIALGDLKGTASALSPGKLSDPVSTREGSMLVFLHSREPAEDAKMQSELAAYTKGLQDTRQFEAFNEWFRKEKAMARMTGLPTQRSDRPETAE